MCGESFDDEQFVSLISAWPEGALVPTSPWNYSQDTSLLADLKLVRMVDFLEITSHY